MTNEQIKFKTILEKPNKIGFPFILFIIDKADINILR